MRGVRLRAADGIAGKVRRAIVAALAVALTSGARADEIADARALDAGGRRADAIALLESTLGRDPTQNDVRVVLGNMLAWEGRYADARAALQPAVDAGRGDAARALVNVELWSGNPDRAERLAAQRATLEPGAADLHVQRARALRAVGRLEDAHAEAEAAASLAPGDTDAAGLREALAMQLRRWEVGSTFSADWFDDGRSPWWEGSLDLSRQTELGSATLHLRRAHRFDLEDNLVELEAYPHLREGTYAYVGAGFAAHGGDVVLYPHERFGLELFQSLGQGFEASLGWRGLFFSSPTHIVTGTFGKYFGSWFAFTRVFFVIPSGGSTSGSVHLNLRRYLADGESYFGFRYAHGLSRDELFTTGDFELNSADTAALETSLALRRGFGVTARASVSRQGRSGLRDLVDVSGGVGVGYRF